MRFAPMVVMGTEARGKAGGMRRLSCRASCLVIRPIRQSRAVYFRSHRAVPAGPSTAGRESVYKGMRSFSAKIVAASVFSPPLRLFRLQLPEKWHRRATRTGHPRFHRRSADVLPVDRGHLAGG